MAHALAVFAELERRLIGERTKAAMAVMRAQDVRLGRAPALPEKVGARITARRGGGSEWTQIARQLNEAQAPTARGEVGGTQPRCGTWLWATNGAMQPDHRSSGATQWPSPTG